MRFNAKTRKMLRRPKKSHRDNQAKEVHQSIFNAQTN
jgi:hypothetical protein